MARIKYNKGILLMLICTIFTASGQFFLKKGIEIFTFSLSGLITNIFLILGVVFYMLGAYLMIIALKFGELSVLYPIISLTFIWVAIMSSLYLNEEMGLAKIFGTGIILTGVILITRGGDK